MKNVEIQKHAFVPKARLIQILGEHLIKDATVGLLELVKNSYDADATGVEIRMSNLNSSGAKIRIKDNGFGMDDTTFVSKWMNPATGHKQLQKKEGQRTRLGRLPLGEKGVGRFATQQIGDRLEMVSKTKEMAQELHVNIDWTRFNDPEMDLAKAEVEFSLRDLELFQDDESGMILEISDLKSKWPIEEVEKLWHSLRRMKSPFKGANDFDVTLSFENCPNDFKRYENLEWSDVLEKAHYKFFGFVDRQGVLDFEYDFNIPGFEKTHKAGQFDLPKEYSYIKRPALPCGGFFVNLYVFDKEKKFLRVSGVDTDLTEISGVSVYRDGLRVLPYGERGNDWLNLGYKRIQKPGDHISNDQIVGMVELNQSDNPLLRDKTNREGLIENESYAFFAKLCEGVVETLEKEMLDDRRSLRPKKERDPQETVDKSFSDISTVLRNESQNPQLALSIQKHVDELKSALGEQVEIFELERDTLLNLAGTGLAAERFTHEFSRIVSGANAALERLARLIISDYERNPKVKREVDTIRGALEALRNDIRLLGPMFYIKKAAKEKELDLGEMISNTRSLQERASDKAGVTTDVIGKPFTVFMREGSCMQVFNNLFDNSIFWLSKKSESDNKKIRILFDTANRFVYFSDSGPGVVPRYKDKIFDPFFSMKGEDGRGLGLYIVKEILQEKGGDIVLVEKDDYPDLLNGASFRIFFGPPHG